MSETRSKSFVYLIRNTKEIFSGRVLPTGLEILQVYFHRRNKDNESRIDSIKAVARDICEIWDKARVPICQERSIIRKLNGMLDKYRNICRNKNRQTTVQRAKEEDFLKSVTLLFDISHHDAYSLMKIEEDKKFLTDQRLKRKYVMGAVDKKLAEKEKRKELRFEMNLKRRTKEELQKRKAETTVSSSTSSSAAAADDISSSDTDEEDDDVDEFVHKSVPSASAKPTKKAKLRAQEVVSQDLSAVLDRTNISNRTAAFLLNTAAQTFSGENPSELPLSSSSIRRSRIKHRIKKAVDTKTEFSHDGPLICHFDGKLLPAISGAPKKEDRLAVLVSGYKMEKLLGVPKVTKGTGAQIAQKVFETLTDWNLQNQIAGLSFDTTAANTGRKNGACVFLEKKLDKPLLWLACRHHMLEVVCGDVFNAIFGATSGPEVLLFKRFQKQWILIDKNQFQPCNDERLLGVFLDLKAEAIKFVFDVLEGKVGEVPREDYRELLELTVIFLGETPSRGISFRAPGAFHHARWMSKLLYVLKISMFQSSI